MVWVLLLPEPLLCLALYHSSPSAYNRRLLGKVELSCRQYTPVRPVTVGHPSPCSSQPELLGLGFRAPNWLLRSSHLCFLLSPSPAQPPPTIIALTFCLYCGWLGFLGLGFRGFPYALVSICPPTSTWPVVILAAIVDSTVHSSSSSRSLARGLGCRGKGFRVIDDGGVRRRKEGVGVWRVRNEPRK